MEHKTLENKTIEFEEILYAIKKRYKLIIIIMLAAIGLAGVKGFLLSKPTYTATVKIFSTKSTEKAEYYSQGDLTSNASLMQTYIQLIKTDKFMNKIAKKSGVDLSAEALKSGVVFSTSQDTPILTIGYTGSSPEVSEKIVNTIASEFENEVKETILNINTKVIEDTKLIVNSPKPVKTLAIGFFGGLILAIGIILFLDYLDNTVKSKKDIEKLLPIPVLGELPMERKLMKLDRLEKKSLRKGAV